MGKKTKINNGFIAEEVGSALSGLVCVDKNYFYVKKNQLNTPLVQDFTKVQSLLHFDGTDGSTTITDSSSYGRTYTCFNNAALTTNTKKYGTASLNLSSSNEFVSTPYNSAWRWSDTDYTVEAWVYPTSSSHGNYPTICGMMSGGSNYWSFGLMNGNYLVFYYWTGSQSYISSIGTVNNFEWSHIAAVHASGTLKVFINGVLDNTTSVVGTPQYSSMQLGFGYWSTSYTRAYVDDFRITQEAVYSDTFLPPSAHPDS